MQIIRNVRKWRLSREADVGALRAITPATARDTAAGLARKVTLQAPLAGTM
jgi:hypothetical protein